MELSDRSDFRATGLIIVLVLLSAVGLAVPPETDCTENPDSQACQEPLFTDDQDIFNYDLRATSDLGTGLGVFHGGQAVNIEDERNILTEGVSSGNTKEYYTVDGSEAGTEGFGEGDIVPNSVELSNPD